MWAVSGGDAFSGRQHYSSRGGSEERRRFLNMMISQYDPVYLEAHMRYNKALMQRNSVIREGGPDADSMLEIYDEQMAPEAEVIYQARQTAD